MNDTTARTTGKKKSQHRGNGLGLGTNNQEGHQLMNIIADNDQPRTCAETRDGKACAQPAGHDAWHTNGELSWSTPLEREIHLHRHGADGQVSSEVRGDRRVTSYGYICVTDDEIIAIAYDSDDSWLAHCARHEVLALADKVKLGEPLPEGTAWRETTVKATWKDGRTEVQDCIRVDVDDWDFAVPCTRRGCDSEGGLHDVSKFDAAEPNLLECALHEVRVGDSVTIEASGDEPWSLLIVDEQIVAPDVMQAFADQVQTAVRLAADLNRPLVDQWRQVGAATGCYARWERVGEKVHA